MNRFGIALLLATKYRATADPPAIKQPVIAELFVALAPTPHLPVTDANDFRCLPPRDLFRHRPQSDFLYFHCPLHGERTA
jgi:hypothetical protein